MRRRNCRFVFSSPTGNREQHMLDRCKAVSVPPRSDEVRPLDVSFHLRDTYVGQGFDCAYSAALDGAQVARNDDAQPGARHRRAQQIGPGEDLRSAQEQPCGPEVRHARNGFTAKRRAGAVDGRRRMRLLRNLGCTHGVAPVLVCLIQSSTSLRSPFPTVVEPYPSHLPAPRSVARCLSFG